MKTQKPVVGVIMGSDSDLPVMKEATDIFQQFNISIEVKVISAHRSPEVLADFAKSAHKRGMKIIIAGAGGAAHLPGVTAAFTPLPVIGIPIKAKSLDGLDSLLSIVQMPAGVPVATVGINQAKNAALLAVQMLAISDGNLLKKMIAYKKKLSEESQKKNEKLKL
ncbi:MAG: 5-(carboxyamino)imidazole ribonucleotide mutase [Ignavibacteria bacterium CG22_combo_CG10-13_8_21_14_all_37_15]|nr:MAG: 5-(carboxyamino)imidazole ribonucleotide mutase [Ignavibacteria bacterium CG22_combo_CG10-13_8_21_14_all_37_15]